MEIMFPLKFCPFDIGVFNCFKTQQMYLPLLPSCQFKIRTNACIGTVAHIGRPSILGAPPWDLLILEHTILFYLQGFAWFFLLAGVASFCTLTLTKLASMHLSHPSIVSDISTVKAFSFDPFTFLCYLFFLLWLILPRIKETPWNQSITYPFLPLSLVFWG